MQKLSLGLRLNEVGSSISSSFVNLLSASADLATVRSSLTDNGDGTFTITCTDDTGASYGYLRMSLTGTSGDLTRDLVGGENLLVSARVKTSNIYSKVYSGALNINKYVSDVDVWETMEFDTIVDDPISETAYIGFNIAYGHETIDETITIDMTTLKIMGNP